MKNRRKIIGLVLAGSMLMQVNTSNAHPCVSPVGFLFVLGAIGGEYAWQQPVLLGL